MPTSPGKSSVRKNLEKKRKSGVHFSFWISIYI